ncbi:sulfatase-like hydrolase/transferase [Fibrobacter sp. UWH1]|uniref:sulfatase-like hydrolase/transferase n=1 Tax=Fibrobacter sp. UWH1 TaxID=1964354 RepID=UPI000B5257A7|nr:sulfatase-like hydrolase/transferase [Fibrobacter sp. UWH1]OWV04408.1 hypothetical protein B7992_15895 [Fibrobacter sp. UWH1]
MAFKSILSSLLITAICAAILPYLACEYFDSPLVLGFVSWDILFLLVLLCLPSKKYAWKLAFLPVVAVYAVKACTPADFTTAGIYSVLILSSLPPFAQNRYVKTFEFLAVGLFSFIGVCSVFFYSTYTLFVSDIWSLSTFYWWGPIVFVFVPCFAMLLQFVFARKILLPKNVCEISPVKGMAILLLALGLHLGVGNIQSRQPILSFPIRNFVWQCLSGAVVSQNIYLQESTQEKFDIWDSTKSMELDKPTVMILVESWGVNKDDGYTQLLLSPYDSAKVSFSGLLKRNEAHTQGAEFEDFELLKDLRSTGLQTWYVHGYNGDFYERKKNYSKYGFDSLLFKPDFEAKKLTSCNYGFKGICDSSIVDFIDGLLNDSIPKFVYWTTLDAHPPYEGDENIPLAKECEYLGQDLSDCFYTTRQLNTARRIAWLAQKHPEYRFVIRGDHRPGGMVKKYFSSSFYHRWVPMVVVNE